MPSSLGVYALIRVFTLLFHSAPPALFALLLAMSAATMVVGLVAALNERDFRRVLSFNLVGHIGYTTASLSLLTPAALAGAIFYVLHHIVVITNLYLVSGVFLRLRRSTDFAVLGGMYDRHHLAAALAVVPIFSLAGVPPLSGFIAKLAIVAAMRSIDLSLPLEERLVQGAELLQRHIAGIWQLFATLGRTTPPRTATTNRPELGDSALAGLFEPDRDRLGKSPEQAARLLRGLIIGCTHPAIVLDVPPMTPTEIVSVLLDGIRAPGSTEPT